MASWLLCGVLLWLQVVFGPANARGPRVLELRDKWNTMAQEDLKAALKRVENYNVAKNIILFLGDGMGVSTVTGMRIWKGQKAGRSGEETILAFEKFPHLALSKTYNTNQQVGDSAGTATAYLTGVKTRFEVLSVDDSVTHANCSTYRPEADLPSILEWAEEAGKSTGIVTTTKITDASPACAYAKSASRNWHDNSALPEDAVGKCIDTARQLIDRGKDIEVVLGGGRRHFMTVNQTDPEDPTKTGRRTDGKDLIKEWIDDKTERGLNSAYVVNKSQFVDIKPEKIDRLFGLFEWGDMQYEIDRVAQQGGPNEPSLAEMTETSLKILKKNKKGYFLFVEGGRIDHGHHDNLAMYALEDGLAFEEAVQVAINNTDPTDTLIVVTADHSHVFSIGSYPSRGNPIFGLSDYEKGSDGKPYTTLAYTNGPGYDEGYVNGSRRNLTSVDTEAVDYKQQTAVPIDSESHAGEDVAIYALGPMAHLFHGTREQNYIPHVMAYAACIGANTDHCEVPVVIKPGPGLVCVTGDATRAQGIVACVLMMATSLIFGFYDNTL